MSDDGMGFQIASAYVQISAKDTGLREQIMAMVGAAVEGQSIEISMAADAAGLREEVTARVKEAGAGEHIDVPIEVSGGEAGFNRVLAEIRALQQEARVSLEVDTGAAAAKIAAVGAEIEAVKQESDSFSTEFEKAMADADKAAAQASASMRQSFSVLESASRTVRAASAELAEVYQVVDSEAKEAATGVDKLAGSTRSAGAAADSGAGSARNISLATMLWTGAALTLGPALLAIPAAIGGLVGGISIATAALKGVFQAMSDAGAASDAIGQSGASLAQQAFSNALQIQSAEQMIVDAKRQAAQAAIQSANSIISAEQQVVSAQYTAAQAAQALADAEANAQNVINDANNNAADATNSVADAKLAAQQAQQNYTAVMANSLSTDLQKAQALQQMKDANQRVVDAQQHLTEATDAANKANQQGVTGIPSVVNAQHAYEQAAQAVTNALRNQATVSQQAQVQAQTSAEAIARAEKNLSDTYQQQALAAAAAASSGSSAANKFQQDMANMTPVGREVTTLLLSMKQGMEGTAQNSFLPGVLALLKDIQPYGAQFKQVVQDIGQGFGGFLAQMGALFNNKQFVSDFFAVFKEGSQFMSTLGSSFVVMFQSMARAAASAAPIVQALATGLGSVLTGLGDGFKGLATGGQGAADTIQAIGGIIGDLLGPLGELIGAISSALGPALVALRPVIDLFVKQFLAAILPMMPALSKALVALVQAFGSLLLVLEPIMPILSEALIGALEILTPLLNLLAKFLADNVGWLKYVAIGLLALVSPMADVVVGVLYMWEHFKGFRDFVGGMITDLHNWFFNIWHFIDGIWHDLEIATDTTWKLIKTYLINPIEDAYNFVTGKFDTLKTIVTKLPGEMASVGAGMWDFVKNTFKGAINTVIGWWDDLNFTTPKIHIPGTPSSWDIGPYTMGLPHIDKLADGGTIRHGGDVIVGDRGMERLTLPPGAVVEPLRHNPSSSGGGGGVTVQSMTININNRMLADFSRPNSMDANSKMYARQIRDALTQVQRDNS